MISFFTGQRQSHWRLGPKMEFLDSRPDSERWFSTLNQNLTSFAVLTRPWPHCGYARTRSQRAWILGHMACSWEQLWNLRSQISQKLKVDSKCFPLGIGNQCTFVSQLHVMGWWSGVQSIHQQPGAIACSCSNATHGNSKQLLLNPRAVHQMVIWLYKRSTLILSFWTIPE